VKETALKNYIAIAEPSDDGKTWWINFPGLPGVTSAADRPERIVA
jgi:predicted RNase H-like HicB family nuclease